MSARSILTNFQIFLCLNIGIYTIWNEKRTGYTYWKIIFFIKCPILNRSPLLVLYKTSDLPFNSLLADGANGSGTIFFKLDQSNHDLAIMRSTFRCTFSRRVREGNEGFTSQNGANAEPKTVGELSSFSSPSLQIPRTIFHGFYSTMHSEWKSF